MKAYTLTTAERRLLVAALHIAADENMNWANRMRRGRLASDSEIKRLIGAYERQAQVYEEWEVKFEAADKVIARMPPKLIPASKDEPSA